MAADLWVYKAPPRNIDLDGAIGTLDPPQQGWETRAFNVYGGGEVVRVTMDDVRPLKFNDRVIQHG